MSIKSKIKNFFTVDEEYEYIEEQQEEEVQQQALQTTQKQQKSGQNVVSLTSIQNNAAKVVLCEPRSYNEVQEIADNIMNRRAVVINLQLVDGDKAKRIVDFLSGTVYALNGDIQKLGAQTFLCTPDNVDVSGTISAMMNDQQEKERGW